MSEPASHRFAAALISDHLADDVDISEVAGAAADSRGHVDGCIQDLIFQAFGRWGADSEMLIHHADGVRVPGLRTGRGEIMHPIARVHSDGVPDASRQSKPISHERQPLGDTAACALRGEAEAGDGVVDDDVAVEAVLGNIRRPKTQCRARQNQAC